MMMCFLRSTFDPIEWLIGPSTNTNICYLYLVLCWCILLVFIFCMVMKLCQMRVAHDIMWEYLPNDLKPLVIVDAIADHIATFEVALQIAETKSF